MRSEVEVEGGINELVKKRGKRERLEREWIMREE